MDFGFPEVPWWTTLAVLVPKMQIQRTNCHQEFGGMFRHRAFSSFDLTPEQMEMLKGNVIVMCRCTITRKHNRVTEDPPTLRVMVNKKLQTLWFKKEAVILKDVSNTVPNRMTLIWRTENEEDQFNIKIGVFLQRIVGRNDLLQKLRLENQYQLATVEILAGDEDIVSQNHIQLSLICPLSQKRMRMPIRARTCGHPQSFDAEMYLEFQYSKPFDEFNCPVCSKTISFDDLGIDWYCKFLLDRPDLQSQNEVKVDSQGNVVVTTPSANNIEVVEVIEGANAVAQPQMEIEIITLD